MARPEDGAKRHADLINPIARSAGDLLPEISAAAKKNDVVDARVRAAEIIPHSNPLGYSKTPLGGRRKRAFDVIGATAIIVLAAPLLVGISLAIRLFSAGPIIYAHQRVGFRGRVFPCFKFRSMVMHADAALARRLIANPAAAEEWASSRKLRKDPRVTPIGRVLRKTSLDELPQLFNVLRGDMSLVGPRPIVAEELPRYGIRTPAYLSARPGMTGLWQVTGRNTTTYERRTELDAAYVSGWRLRHDVGIILRTIPEVMATGRTS